MAKNKKNKLQVNEELNIEEKYELLKKKTIKQLYYYAMT